ncbi:MAG: peptidoglycan editing factor PgeF [Alphaproteobacteria bacterium]|nr:peptidoglycan editing factor PgeF [Alphaproteobacteria bacterium]
MVILRSDNLSGAGLAHGFFGRTGGVSTGIFASLNCGPGSGDDRSHVIENRRRALSKLTPDSDARLLTLYQIHSAAAAVVTAPWEMGEGPKADAMATNVPRLALGVLTADCAPVLLADAGARVIGAAHAGWKGAFSGVIESVLQSMEQLGASRVRIAAAIGPCISQENYEVGPEFVDRFRDADEGNSRWFAMSDRPDHFRFDLPGYVRHRLEEAGIVSVERVAACTYDQEQRFFSFRRATHRGETDYGRQLSALLLTR